MKAIIIKTKIDCSDYASVNLSILESVLYCINHYYICIANVHMIMEAYDDPDFQKVINNAAIVTPDGMPLVWALKLLGYKNATRVYGPTLTLKLCEQAALRNVSIGFYGSSDVVIQSCVKRLRKLFPRIKIDYIYSPPFRNLTSEEENVIIENIIKSGIKILFVGLGCPKQERWMARHTNRLPLVMLGVGAAFDFIAGSKSQAPLWMQNSGLEWFYRLLTEPKRLWRRYLFHNPRFIVLFLIQYLKYITKSKD